MNAVLLKKQRKREANARAYQKRRTPAVAARAEERRGKTQKQRKRECNAKYYAKRRAAAVAARAEEQRALDCNLEQLRGGCRAQIPSTERISSRRCRASAASRALLGTTTTNMNDGASAPIAASAAQCAATSAVHFARVSASERASASAPRRRSHASQISDRLAEQVRAGLSETIAIDVDLSPARIERSRRFVLGYGDDARVLAVYMLVKDPAARDAFDAEYRASGSEVATAAAIARQNASGKQDEWRGCTDL